MNRGLDDNAGQGLLASGTLLVFGALIWDSPGNGKFWRLPYVVVTGRLILALLSQLMLLQLRINSPQVFTTFNKVDNSIKLFNCMQLLDVFEEIHQLFCKYITRCHGISS